MTIFAGGKKKSKNKVFYPLFYSLTILFIGVWIANGMGLIVDGTGGDVVYSGHTDENGVLQTNGEYDICSERQDLIDCQGTVTTGETYPCDPNLDSSNCANSLTPFKEHSSMPAGFYSDGILMYYRNDRFNYSIISPSNSFSKLEPID